jgi:hypothetical protein
MRLGHVPFSSGWTGLRVFIVHWRGAPGRARTISIPTRQAITVREYSVVVFQEDSSVEKMVVSVSARCLTLCV